MQGAPAEAGVQVMVGTHGDTGRLPLSVEDASVSNGVTYFPMNPKNVWRL